MADRFSSLALHAGKPVIVRQVGVFRKADAGTGQRRQPRQLRGMPKKVGERKRVARAETIKKGVAGVKWRAYHIGFRINDAGEYAGPCLIPACADCGGPIYDRHGPPDGGELEDGRKVCQDCCAKDLRRISEVVTS